MKITSWLGLLFAIILIPLSSIPAWSQEPTGPTMSRVNVSSDGTQANGLSWFPALSADGRFVSFTSYADNLVSDDTNAYADVFVHDRLSGQTKLVSKASNGGIGNQDSLSFSSLSADGQYVTFDSSADNLVADDINGTRDVFLHDLSTGTTTMVSIASDGEQTYGGAEASTISADGRYIAFVSFDGSLVKDDWNRRDDIFVHDRSTGETKLISSAIGGGPGNSDSELPSISADGRYIAFTSGASNLVTQDANNAEDIFVYDQETGVMTLVSVATDGTQGNFWSTYPSISENGRYVVFTSEATNLVDSDTNNRRDIFLRDLFTGTTEIISIADDRTQGNHHSGYYGKSVSADGRFVSFCSAANNLAPNDTNPESDVFLRDRETGKTALISIAPDGTHELSYSCEQAIADNGQSIAFISTASNLVEADTNHEVDVFVYDLGEPESPPDAIDIRITAPQQLSLNDDGWYAENPTEVQVHITNNTESVFAGSLEITFSNQWRLLFGTDEEFFKHPDRLTLEINALENGRSLDRTWKQWTQPMEEQTIEFTARVFDAAGVLVNQDVAQMRVPTANIHPVVVLPGLMGSMKNAFGEWTIDPIKNTYQNLLEELELAGYESGISLFIFPYDWRQHIQKSGHQLGERIRQDFLPAAATRGYIDSDSVDLIGHSLGGLVSRAYVQGDTYTNDVHRLITLGTPHLGAPKAYLAAEGLEFDFLDDFLGPSGKLFAEKLLRAFAWKKGYCTDLLDKCLTTKADLHDYIEAEVPSIREIFPVDDYLKDDPDGYLISADNQNVIFPFGRHFNGFLASLNFNIGTLIDRLGAENVISVIGDRHIESDPSSEEGVEGTRPLEDTDTYYLVVERTLLDNIFDMWRNGRALKGLSFRPPGRGDRTVPLNSADISLIDNTASYIYKFISDNKTLIEHGNLPSQFQQRTVELLTQSRPFFDAGFIDPGINWKNALLLINLSPVEVQITDPLRRRVGWDFDSENELSEIPGSVFSRSTNAEEPDFIIVPDPAEGEYRINLLGIGDGDYQVQALSLSEGGVQTIEEFTGNTSIGELREFTTDYTVSSLHHLPLYIEWLPPLDDPDEPLKVSRSRTIPIKFAIRDAQGEFVEDDSVRAWVADPNDTSSAIASFSMTESSIGGNGDAIRIDPEKKHYIVNLHLQDYPFEADQSYIIVVSLPDYDFDIRRISIKPEGKH